MRKYLLACLLSVVSAPAWAAFTEFYCNPSTGSNVNAGSTEGSPIVTGDADDWVSSTGVYTFGNATDLSGVSAGMFAAVRVDGATTAALVGRITNVNDGADTVTISTTAKSGSLADQNDTASIAIGGAWKGPNGSDGFPLNFVTFALQNANSEVPRINLKNNATYAITAQITPSGNGPIFVQGYTTTAGDLGRATIDGGTTGASYSLVKNSGSTTQWRYVDLIFQNNGATGTAIGLDFSSSAYGSSFVRCKIAGIRGTGIHVGSGVALLLECEVTDCGKANSFGCNGVQVGSATTIVRCYIHDNTAVQAIGVYALGQTIIVDSIIAKSGSMGIYARNGSLYMNGCDVYQNGSEGLGSYYDGDNYVAIENCNFLKNSGWGIDLEQGTKCGGHIFNCAFGSGSQANASGTISAMTNKSFDVSGTFTYASGVTPWVDPANGDFRINLPAAKAAGRGVFPPGATNTVGFPDIGAAQSQGAGGGVSRGRIVNQ